MLHPGLRNNSDGFRLRSTGVREELDVDRQSEEETPEDEQSTEDLRVGVSGELRGSSVAVHHESGRGESDVLYPADQGQT